ncbi:MAG: PP2C family serine/threonine-protein phosphatase [Bryobacteraceae bacterium]
MKLPPSWRRFGNNSPEIGSPEPVIIENLMLEAFGISDPGCVRTNNEDFYLLFPNRGLYLVADGMGGAQAGEHASKLAGETVAEYLWKNYRTDPDVLAHAFEEANRRVMAAASSDASLEGMGTTLVAAFESEKKLQIASVGDSRAYVQMNGQLIVVTEDQTWVQEVGRRLGLDEDSLKSHPMRHVLTMAIGVSPDLRIHSYVLEPHPGMQVLLCSDGLHGVIPESTIVETLQSEAPLEEKCQRLVKAARDAGGPDNVTAVLLQCVA